ncbi:Rv3235 family protein [Actinoplanes sp. HUAS TT8]|uniref:Rv3235 family protein n=1 Tax=Actinoplanes sp. HUAS TT8 TaxID=3447453 RepID=UPI003F5235D1
MVGASGDAKLAVKRFVQTCVEVLNGHRPAAHLRRLSTPGEAADVVAQGLAGARRVADMRRPRRPGDRRHQRTTPVAVLRVHLCEPRPGAVEVAVALVTGERTWAMALRLELHKETWSATALRLI